MSFPCRACDACVVVCCFARVVTLCLEVVGVLVVYVEGGQGKDKGIASIKPSPVQSCLLLAYPTPLSTQTQPHTARTTSKGRHHTSPWQHRGRGRLMEGEWSRVSKSTSSQNKWTTHVPPTPSLRPPWPYLPAENMAGNAFGNVTVGRPALLLFGPCSSRG